MVANRMQVLHYYAYLLRCWPEGDLLQPDAPASRFSIEDRYTGERQDFATLEALVAFLHELSACDATGAPHGRHLAEKRDAVVTIECTCYCGGVDHPRSAAIHDLVTLSTTRACRN